MGWTRTTLRAETERSYAPVIQVIAQVAGPLPIDRSEAERPGLMASTIAWAFDRPFGNAVYDVAKSALVRLAYVTAEELRPHRVAVGGDRARLHPHRAGAGRARRAAVRPVRHGELAHDYGFTDVDGSRPEPFRLP